MKKIILAVIIFFPILLLSQNSEPTQRKFYVPALQDSVYLMDTLQYFKQDRFIKGSHWDYHIRLGKVVNYNQMDIYWWYEPKTDTSLKRGDTSLFLLDSSLLFVKPMYYTHSLGAEMFNIRGIQYSPTLLIDTNKTNELQTRYGDGTNPIFGFAHIRGRITNNPADTNYSKLIIDGDSLINQVILEEPWTANQLKFSGGSSDWSIGYRDTVQKEFLCRGMYITINLRRDDLSNELDTMPVLKIEIPHEYVSQVLNWGETVYYADGGNLYLDNNITNSGLVLSENLLANRYFF